MRTRQCNDARTPLPVPRSRTELASATSLRMWIVHSCACLRTIHVRRRRLFQRTIEAVACARTRTVCERDCLARPERDHGLVADMIKTLLRPVLTTSFRGYAALAAMAPVKCAAVPRLSRDRCRGLKKLPPGRSKACPVLNMMRKHNASCPGPTRRAHCFNCAATASMRVVRSIAPTRCVRTLSTVWRFR